MSRKSVAAKFQNEAYDISVTGRNVLVTDAMKSYAIDKISKIDRFNNRVSEVSVVMDIQKLEHRIDINMKADHIFIKCTGCSENMYASIDIATNKLQAQLRRYKRRIRDHQKKEGAVIEMNVNVLETSLTGELDELNEEIEFESTEELIDQYRPHKIVDRETRPLKTLSQHEAIMKMELSGDIFLIFRAEEDQKLKVIYRRKDGHFGVIEPE